MLHLACQIQWWCTDDALMMHWWCTDDALMMRWWCADDALLIHWWCADDVLMMRWWCVDDALRMLWWCTDDVLMMHWWCADDAPMMQYRVTQPVDCWKAEFRNFVKNYILILNKLSDALFAVLGSNPPPDTWTSSHSCGSGLSCHNLLVNEKTVRESFFFFSP